MVSWFIGTRVLRRSTLLLLVIVSLCLAVSQSDGETSSLGSEDLCTNVGMSVCTFCTDTGLLSSVADCCVSAKLRDSCEQLLVATINQQKQLAYKHAYWPYEGGESLRDGLPFQNDDFQKRRSPFLGKRKMPFLGKRRSPFLGKRDPEEGGEFEEEAIKRSRSPFLGKRRSPFLG